MRVPTYTRQVGTAAAPTVRQQGLPGAVFGEVQARQAQQAAGALGAVSTAMNRVAQDQQRRRDEAWLSSTAAEFKASSDDYLYNPESGILNKKMQAAQGMTNQAVIDLDTQIKNLADTAPTPALGQALINKLGEFRATQLRVSSRHEGDQLRKWEAVSAEEDANVAITAWTRNWSMSAAEYDTNFERVVKPSLERVSQVTGKPVESLIREKQAQGRAAMIKQNIAAGALEKAKDLNSQWGDDLLPADKLKITATMRKKEVEMTSDNMANNIFEQLQNEDISSAQAREQIRAIADADVRNRTRTMFRSLEADYKVQQKELQEDLTASYADEIDNRTESLADQQDYVLNLPADTAPERKAKKAAMARYKMYAKSAGVSPQSDASAFERISDGIITGTVNKSTQITGSEDGALLTASDRKQLVKTLKHKQSLTMLKQKFIATLGKDYKADKWREFMPYALERVEATNKGDDPVFIQTLVDNWRMSGETKSLFLPGWGRDKNFGKAHDDPDWLPDIPENDLPDFTFQFNQNLDIKQKWLSLYNGEEEYALRAAYKQYRQDLVMSEAERQAQ